MVKAVNTNTSSIRFAFHTCEDRMESITWAVHCIQLQWVHPDEPVLQVIALALQVRPHAGSIPEA